MACADRHMQLCVRGTVGLVVMMIGLGTLRRGRNAPDAFRCHLPILKCIFQGMRKVMHVFERAAPQRQDDRR